MLNSLCLYKMSQADIEKIDPAALVNISAVSIDPALPQADKMEEYLSQIGNPYCFISGKTPVKIRFIRPDRSLAQSLGNYLSRLSQK